MSHPTDTAPRGPVRGLDRLPPWAWAAAIFVPYLVMALRALLNGAAVYLSGDFALMDLQVRAAQRWDLLVGVYSRFGWHHPGPFYLYLISFLERLTGPVHGAQAQVATAALIGGGALAATVLVVGGLGGRRGAAATALAAAGVSVATASALSSPWSPYVVVFPVLLLSVLGVAAARGSTASWAGALVVATFVVQTDVETTLYALAVVVGSGAALAVGRARRGAWRTTPHWVLTLVLVAAAGAAWVPPLVDQFSSPGGNLTAVASFLVHPPGRAGVVRGAATTGTSQAAAVGLVAPLFAVASRLAGLVRLGVVAVVAAGLVVWSRRVRDGLAGALSFVFAAGSVLAVAAGAGIVGRSFPYLLAWSRGVADTGLVALAILCARGVARRTTWPVTGVVSALGVATFAALSLLASPLARLESPDVAATWHLAAPRVEPGIPSVYVTQRTTGVLAFVSPMWGLVDQLDLHGLHPKVAPRWEYRVGAHYVSAHPGAVSVVLYPPMPSDRALAGFVGHTPYADVVVVTRRQR